VGAWLQWGTGLVVSGAFGTAAYRLGTIDRRGLVAGIAVGWAIYGGLGPSAFGLLAMFFVLGSSATRIGKAQKDSLGVAQSSKGARTVRHVLPNGGVAALCALVAALSPEAGPVWAAAFCGSLAAATADTLSSEIGQAFGGEPRRLPTFRHAKVGEDGGVTLVGTAAGAVGALVIAAVAALVGLTPSVGAVAAAGIAGNVADSLIGGTFERRGWVNNAVVNLICTSVGAAVAAVLGDGA